MSKLTLAMATICLTGCAEWRGLQIDGSSTAAFEESISRLEQELPSAYRKQIFALAIGDVAVDSKIAGHSDEDYRAQLDGLTYNGVIALTDQTGASVRTQYYSGRTYAQVLAEQLHQQRLDAKTAPYFPPWARGNRASTRPLG
jgi:hypothetical protein